ncbi:DegT/DnrJ/EryC1/StrS family aminotransferase [Sphingomonas sp. CGMCC 1.13654]|uniref:DegT/DnrJ/EryC1/StrS family aminotransferase n=1 Tax=Sphingomonas chungangi TaxID=2683589 RepID=A0A838L7W2_9SPHN|nr:DegT/DnrJ/EryC1/StrS family aminotransferase [Sphingomonas chungangi]MBA2935401.1 DegT/DnrJ/EryC1/StrS family aminotransferase [Sphingomonas chungangi]MVW56907.1 aminotransferase DegT [Sphingomonas chungangi]
MPIDLPLIRPNPPKLSQLSAELEAIEASGTFSNYGPVARRFERAMTDHLFGGRGACLAVANATLGLMIALRHATLRMDESRKLALLPAFTFAATGQAAQWAGLTPLLADCDPDDWALCPKAEERLLADYGKRIAAIVPYATFGNSIDLDRYAWLARRHDVAIVIDAAASLGSLDAEGRGFGTGAPFPVVYSMHATKTFSTSEGGVIHCADPGVIEKLRAMANFGFEGSRSATMPGMNAKLAEVPALIAEAKLGDIHEVALHRTALAERYRERLAAFSVQRPRGHAQAVQFMSVLLPRALAEHRGAIIERLAEAGIGAGTYFSPHLGEQPWFRESCVIDALPVTDDIAARMLALPVTDDMTIADVDRVSDALIAACYAQPRSTVPATPLRDRVLGAVVIGGGPAGVALLCAAGKAGKLDALASTGFAMVDRGETMGGGRLGAYEITSDSSAETFLTADGALPAGLGIAGEAAGQAIAEHKGALGVPLPKVGAYLDRLGEVLGQRLRSLGGSILNGHEVISSQRTADGLWRTRARRVADGGSIELISRSIVIATGGHQPAIRLAEEKVAGMSLVERCGNRLIQSDTLLAVGGIEAARDRLPEGRAARIAIVGGSTSAVTAAVRLLKSGLPLDPGGVTLFHRRPLRPFYPSIDAAQADGYTDFGPDDICPVSGFVYRLAGFRLEARELVVHALGIGGRVGDPRLKIHQLSGGDDTQAAAILDQADLVIAAFGYQPHALPLIDERGRAIRLRCEGPVRGRMVDDLCRVVDTDACAVPGVYGIGLAAGFVPHGKLGGEASFRGQANGLWLWQNDVGQLIVEQLLSASGAIGAKTGAARRAVA